MLSNLFRNCDLSDAEKLELLGTYVSNTQSTHIPFKFCLNTKIEGEEAQIKRMLLNIWDEATVDKAIQCPSIADVIESCDFVAAYRIPNDIFKNGFIRDELKTLGIEPPKLKDFINKLIPVTISESFEFRLLSILNKSPFGRITPLVEQAKKMTAQASIATLHDPETVTMYYKTSTGTVVCFQDNELAFVPDAFATSILDTHNGRTNLSDKYWTKPHFLIS
ncbi:hypothetical protein [Photobacterium kishitanii]|uniref:Uncharacterized protein n=1 Tax=Photobacterium kishitanii TaxID=318456 RepID=A0A2T3KL11_9GAMM|nr:hypothetical protein [Photobacterium kishitanii]PSV00356.1 hypothetical protein C9J27_04310 [Photobacterium kishitanii]